jgi:pimeloyl-ACP methyl ester carboxylesterase
MLRTITAGTRQVTLREEGTGEPVLFVHAFPLSAEMWEPQLVSPPAGWRFIAPDLRGFGRSSHQSGATSVEAHAQDLVALLDALAVDRSVVVGLSMGGYVTLALLRAAPERVRAVVLCDTRADADTDEARANRQRLREQLRDGGPPSVADAMVPRLLGPTTMRERPEVAGRVRGLIEANRALGIDEAIVTLMTRPDSTPGLVRIGVPTLLVAGEEDGLTPVALHERMREHIPGARLVVIPGAGHLSNLECPDEFNEALSGFLRRPGGES